MSRFSTCNTSHRSYSRHPVNSSEIEDAPHRTAPHGSDRSDRICVLHSYLAVRTAAGASFGERGRVHPWNDEEHVPLHGEMSGTCRFPAFSAGKGCLWLSSCQSDESIQISDAWFGFSCGTVRGEMDVLFFLLSNTVHIRDHRINTQI